MSDFKCPSGRWGALIWIAALILSGCAATPAPIVPVALPSPTLDPLAQAALEATAIVRRAEATAIVQRAQATADALVAPIVPTATASAANPAPIETPGPTALPQPTANTPPAISVSSVGFGAKGAYIHVQFMASVKAARGWQQGSVTVIDEATGTEFREIPVLPIIGPLISRPIRDGLGGYVMLVHAPPILKPGSLVTVKLGDYVQEHIAVIP
ncbi:MAG: hypothetical protein U0559_15785 [Anaerolineae bacterium]